MSQWLSLREIACAKRSAATGNGSERMEAIPAPRLEDIFVEPPIGFKDWDYTPRGIFFSRDVARVRARLGGDPGTLGRRRFLSLPTQVGFSHRHPLFPHRGADCCGARQQQLKGDSQMTGGYGRGESIASCVATRAA